jgi:hypothetical protein
MQFRAREKERKRERERGAMRQIVRPSPGTPLDPFSLTSPPVSRPSLSTRNSHGRLHHRLSVPTGGEGGARMRPSLHRFNHVRLVRARSLWGSACRCPVRPSRAPLCARARHPGHYSLLCDPGTHASRSTRAYPRGEHVTRSDDSLFHARALPRVAQTFSGLYLYQIGVQYNAVCACAQHILQGRCFHFLSAAS